jgi:hypothetical protein
MLVIALLQRRWVTVKQVIVYAAMLFAAGSLNVL